MSEVQKRASPCAGCAAKVWGLGGKDLDSRNRWIVLYSWAGQSRFLGCIPNCCRSDGPRNIRPPGLPEPLVPAPLLRPIYSPTGPVPPMGIVPISIGSPCSFLVFQRLTTPTGTYLSSSRYIEMSKFFHGKGIVTRNLPDGK